MAFKQFVINDTVDEETERIGNEILIDIKNDDLQGYFYMGYPIFEKNKKKRYIPIMFATKRGLFIFYTNEQDIDAIDSHIMKLTADSTELKKIYKEKNAQLLKFIDIKNYSTLKDYYFNSEDLLCDELFFEINSFIQNTYSMNKTDTRIIHNKTSIGNVIKDINNRIATLDEIQFDSIYKKVDKHMRIRGLAGSGKTILLVRKMAYLHFKYPDLRMAFVFYTRSLKEYIQSLFINAFKDFSPNRDPNFEYVKIMHGWGSSKNEGFYYLMTQLYEKEFKTYNDMVGHRDRLGSASSILLKQIENDKKEYFDFVFIDEAQDFNIDFFKLVLKSLTLEGKIFYAYDELQTLDINRLMPSIKDIFDTDDTSICETIDLDKSYRCPSDLLVTAHAIGLGIYHLDNFGNIKFINMIEDLSFWEGVGYRVEEGSLDFGKDVTLYRTEDTHYKNALQNIEVIISKTFTDFNSQYQALIEEITHLIKNEEVNPNDILIIDLDSINLAVNFNYLWLMFSTSNLYDLNFQLNLVNKDSAETFYVEDKITYTTVFRAKGNEANIVFILNSSAKENVFVSSARNRLFTAMTRSKVRTYVYGVHNEDIVNEIDKVKEHDYRLSFKYPTPTEMKEIKKISEIEHKEASAYDITMERIYKLIEDPKTKDEAIKDLLKMIEKNEKN
ncbi:MAG TPA: ATP-binding domain-containing protein [Bacteroidales bacterium]|nr:ATP-binding domain-containing protein [Bacteroidales bacterium]